MDLVSSTRWSRFPSYTCNIFQHRVTPFLCICRASWLPLVIPTNFTTTKPVMSAEISIQLLLEIMKLMGFINSFMVDICVMVEFMVNKCQNHQQSCDASLAARAVGSVACSEGSDGLGKPRKEDCNCNESNNKTRLVPCISMCSIVHLNMSAMVLL